VKKAAAGAKKTAAAAARKSGAKKKAAPAKKAKKPAGKPSKPKKSPARKVAVKVKASAKAVAKSAAKSAKKAVAKAVKPVKAAAPKAKAAPAPKVKIKAAAVPKAAPAAPKAPVPPAIAKPIAPRPAAPEPEKKRGRRARPRVQSTGAPAAAWLSTEKPRPASFIPAPPRAEAPSAIAAPPASSDRLIRPEDVAHPAVRTVPVRIDIEQGAGRFYVIANPMEVTVRVGEGIEWDFRYIGGADVTVEEIVIEFEKPSPFAHATFRTHKPGGARPHRQLSDGALAAAAGRRVQYTVRAMTPFKTELASTKVWVNIAA
jgi:hypothetical protein